MYRPAHFQENDPATLAAFVDTHPLAVLVAAGPSGLVANHIPLLRLQNTGDQMILRGHVARGNDFWKTTPADSSVLAIFGGPDRYISPAWYPTKAETGEVVPTWNYLVVHAHGRITFTQDPLWLRTLVEALTNRHEGARTRPWKVSDAPSEYVDRMLRAIVGFEIAVERLEGKFKASQNRTERERAGAIAGLAADGDPQGLIAQIVRSNG
ncbi:MAG: FMN-binding negative transcriptional regulator [Steroidobacteraceae bacterium]|jgi:transcriptional regulator